MIAGSQNRWWRLLLFAVLGLTVATPVQAVDRLMGNAEVKYIDYSSRSHTTGDLYEAESFSQRYNLTYIMDSMARDHRRRPLEYNFIVGYEWLAIDTSIRDGNFDSNPSFRNGRLYYLGEASYDPPTMPLSLTVFVRDMQRTNVSSVMAASGRNIVQAVLPISLQTTGLHLQTGATLTFGEKSGLSSRYNKLFSQIPMLFLDYTEQIDKDDHGGDFRVDSRTRRLAFVSLNKKDNWFHYRTEQFEDYVNTKNSWQRSEFQLGTVDQQLTRHWVDLTNWISISADAQFTKLRANNTVVNFEDYNLNLFTTAARKAWQLRTFSTFNRRNENGIITAARSIPVSLSGVWGADTDWSSNVLIRDRQTDGFKNSEEFRSFSLRGTTFKRSPFRLSPQVAVQYYTSSAAKTLDLKGGLDLGSTRKFSAVHDLFFSYNAQAHLMSGASTGENEYFKQTMSARWLYRAADRLLWNFQQHVYVSNTLNGASAFQTGAAGSTDYIKSVTTGIASWVPNASFSSSLQATHELTSYSGEGTDNRQVVRLNLEYKSEALRSTIGTGLDRQVPMLGESTTRFDLFANLDYTPTQAYSTMMRARYNLEQQGGADAGTSFDLNLKSRYDLYPTAFAGRPIVKLEQEFSYSQSSYGEALSWVRLMVRYYPYSRISLNGASTVNILGGSQQIYSVGADLNLKYFQSAIDYSYGRRSSDQRIDRRFAASVRRSF